MHDELRQMSKTVRSGLTESEAGALGAVLARQNLVARTMTRQLPRRLVDRLGQYLAMKQLEWQANRSAGLDAALLTEQLNAHLETATGPDYLRIRPAHIEYGRLEIWAYLPELSTGPDRGNTTPDIRLLPASMSPFEAYLVADWAVASKILNPAFSRTDDEAAIVWRAPAATQRLVLAVAEPNPRVEAFVNHIARVRAKKWRDVDSAMRAVVDAMEKSYRR